MKKEVLITIVCTVGLLLFNCKGSVQKAEGDSNGAKTITLSSIEESFPDTSYFRPSKAVVLEMTEESLISEISRIAMDDNILFIYCKQSDELFMFDINGKYISKIDCKGEGPNEYLQTKDFTIDTATKQIILLCAVPEKRMYFTYKGEFIKQEKNPEYFSLFATDGNHIYFENSSGYTTNQLYILNTKTDIIKENLKTLDIKTRFFVNGNSISRCKNILYVRRFDNTVYELKNGEITEKYRVDFKNHSFPEYFLTEEDDNVISRESRAHDYIYSMSNATENDHYLMFYTNRGLFIYDKRNDLLKGYKKMSNSKLLTFWQSFFFSFPYYLPVENTNMIACTIDEPSLIKSIGEIISDEPDNVEIKTIQNKYPEWAEEIVHIGNQLTDESNPVLFIYEFKD